MKFRLTLLLLAATPAWAAPPDWAAPVLADGLAAQAAGDYPRALRDFRRLAGQGSAIAETMLGVMSARGQGIAADPATAATWWLRAAQRGYPPAQLALARACVDGRGIAVDAQAAWVWARLAATHGDTPTAIDAAVLADTLGRGFDAATLAKLEQRRQDWRPWATLAD